MHIWTLGLLVGTMLVMLIGVVYGALRQQATERPEMPMIMLALGGAISMVWLAAGVLTVQALL
jgi:hypothetical protein